MVIQDCHICCMFKRHSDCTHNMINVSSEINISGQLTVKNMLRPIILV